MLAYCFFILSRGPLQVPVLLNTPFAAALPRLPPQCPYSGCVWQLSAEFCRNKHSHLDLRRVKKSARGRAGQRAAQISNGVWLMKGSVFEWILGFWVPSFIPPPSPQSSVETLRPRPDLWKGLHQFSLYTFGIRCILGFMSQHLGSPSELWVVRGGAGGDAVVVVVLVHSSGTQICMARWQPHIL